MQYPTSYITIAGGRVSGLLTFGRNVASER